MFPRRQPCACTSRQQNAWCVPGLVLDAVSAYKSSTMPSWKSLGSQTQYIRCWHLRQGDRQLLGLEVKSQSRYGFQIVRQQGSRCRETWTFSVSKSRYDKPVSQCTPDPFIDNADMPWHGSNSSNDRPLSWHSLRGDDPFAGNRKWPPIKRAIRFSPYTRLVPLILVQEQPDGLTMTWAWGSNVPAWSRWICGESRISLPARRSCKAGAQRHSRWDADVNKAASIASIARRDWRQIQGVQTGINCGNPIMMTQIV